MGYGLTRVTFNDGTDFAPGNLTIVIGPNNSGKSRLLIDLERLLTQANPHTSTDVDGIIVSGGVFQNALLMDILAAELGERLWFNTRVPPNDGGLSLGQAAQAAVHLSS